MKTLNPLFHHRKNSLDDHFLDNADLDDLRPYGYLAAIDPDHLTRKDWITLLKIERDIDRGMARRREALGELDMEVPDITEDAGDSEAVADDLSTEVAESESESTDRDEMADSSSSDRDDEESEGSGEDDKEMEDEDDDKDGADRWDADSYGGEDADDEQETDYHDDGEDTDHVSVKEESVTPRMSRIPSEMPTSRPGPSVAGRSAQYRFQPYPAASRTRRLRDGEVRGRRPMGIRARSRETDIGDDTEIEEETGLTKEERADLVEMERILEMARNPLDLPIRQRRREPTPLGEDDGTTEAEEQRVIQDYLPLFREHMETYHEVGRQQGRYTSIRLQQVVPGNDAECRFPGCVYTTINGEDGYRFVLDPIWSGLLKNGKPLISQGCVMTFKEVLKSEEYYHVQCLEHLLHMTDLRYLLRLRPETRRNIPDNGAQLILDEFIKRWILDICEGPKETPPVLRYIDFFSKSDDWSLPYGEHRNLSEWYMRGYIFRETHPEYYEESILTTALETWVEDKVRPLNAISVSPQRLTTSQAIAMAKARDLVEDDKRWEKRLAMKDYTLQWILDNTACRSRLLRE